MQLWRCGLAESIRHEPVIGFFDYCSSVSLIELLWQLCRGPDLIWETFCNKKASVVRTQLLPTGIVVLFVKKSLFLKSIDQQKSTTSSGQIQT